MSARELQRGIAVTVEEVKGVEARRVNVSFGVPFPKGLLADEQRLALFDNGVVIPSQRQAASRYSDGSVRACLMRFRADLLPREKKRYLLRLAEKASNRAVSIPFEFRDNIFVHLPTGWYCRSGVFGPMLPAAQSTISPALEQRMAKTSGVFTGQRLELTDNGYYDHAHAQHVVFVRTGSHSAYFDARRWAVFHQKEHRRWLSTHKPGAPISWSRLRRMYIEGLVEDYLITGDPESREVAEALADAYSRSLAANRADFQVNERNPSFPIIGLTCVYELTGEKKYLDSARQIVELACAWRDRKRGGWIRVYEDKQEWDDPRFKGGSPFMTALLMEGLIRYHRLTGDEKARQAIVGATDWLVKECWWPNIGRPGSPTFAYIQCPPPGRGEIYDLNMMFLEMLGYTWHLTGERKYLDVATQALAGGLKSFGAHPKAYNQAMRSCARGLYWMQQRPLAAPPGPKAPEPKSRPAGRSSDRER